MSEVTMTREQLVLDPNYEEIEGLFVNTETGEVVDPEALAADASKDTANAEFVLKRLTGLDGKKVGLETQKKALINAVEQNVGRQLKRVEQARAFVEASNLDFLKSVAESEIEKKNAGKPKDKWKKFWECAFGRLSFKAYAGKLSVKADEKSQGDALAWCKTNAPGAIQRHVSYSINLEEIDEETRAGWLSGEETPPDFLSVEKQSDRFYVNTNVKA